MASQSVTRSKKGEVILDNVQLWIVIQAERNIYEGHNK